MNKHTKINSMNL